MNVNKLPVQSAIAKTPKKPATPPKSDPPAKKEPGDSVVLRGLAGAGKALVGGAGFLVGGSVGALRGVVTGAAAEPTPKAQAEPGVTKTNKAKSFLRHAGAAAGLAVGVAMGLAFAPAGIAIAAGATAVAGLTGAAIGATTPEVVPRIIKAGAGGVTGFKDGGVAGWNLARKPFAGKPSKETPPPKPETKS